MEYPMLLPLAGIILTILISYKIWSAKRNPTKGTLPPSPPSLPILGHIHLLKQPLHQCLHALSQKHGPVISLRLGFRLVVVVSSPEAIEECFTKNDITLANRARLIMSKYLAYNYSTLGSSDYTDHWRNLRRITAIDVFSAHRLSAFVASRREEVISLVGNLYQASRQNGFGYTKVALRPMFSELTFDVAMIMIAGKRFSGEKAREFREIIREAFVYSGASYAGDYFPVLEWIDFQGYVKKAKRMGLKTDELFQGLVDEQRTAGRSDNGDSMIGHLLSLQESQPEYYTDETIKGLILDIIFAGTDTSSGTLEWAMSELLNHPDILEKARKELEDHVGHDEDRFVEETDISKSPYLQSIISETLRLHPPGPLLLPHVTSKPCSVGGYTLPGNTMLLVNAWAVHRDPKLWDDALCFKPERFENGQPESFGPNSYKYLPFGLGRRACPGSGMANRILGLTLGLLIQCFDWKRVNEAEVDMTEGIGLTMPRAEALEVLCNVRDDKKKLLSLSFGLDYSN